MKDTKIVRRNVAVQQKKFKKPLLNGLRGNLIGNGIVWRLEHNISCKKPGRNIPWF
jgi:hypothetical protein